MITRIKITWCAAINIIGYIIVNRLIVAVVAVLIHIIHIAILCGLTAFTAAYISIGIFLLAATLLKTIFNDRERERAIARERDKINLIDYNSVYIRSDFGIEPLFIFNFITLPSIDTFASLVVSSINGDDAVVSLFNWSAILMFHAAVILGCASIEWLKENCCKENWKSK